MSMKKHLSGASILAKAKRALSDDSGSIKILTAVTLLPMMMAAGVAIDTAELYRAKVNFQSAVDAAAVVTARSISRGATVQEAKTAGREIFEQNMSNLPSSTATIKFPDLKLDACSNGGVNIEASMNHPVFFNTFHQAFGGDGNEEGAVIDSTGNVACGNESIEIALVLDNSGSMGSAATSTDSTAKITVLKAAATNLVQTLHAQLATSPTPNPISFSVVPFSGMVNVGPGTRNETWMDTDGISPSHWGDPSKKYFYDWDSNPDVVPSGLGYVTTGGQPVSRFTLYDNLPVSEAWLGCVEARPHPYNEQDDTPSAAVPETLTVPAFSPDTPDNWNGQNTRVTTTVQPPYCVTFRFYSRWGYLCTVWSDGRTGFRHPTQGIANYYSDAYQNRGEWLFVDSGGATITVDGPVIQGELYYQNNYLRDDHNYKGSLDARHHLNSGLRDQPLRQAWTTKYFRDSSGNKPTIRDDNNHDRTAGAPPTVLGIRGGPNVLCNSEPITDLTPSEVEVQDALNDMRAHGATNIQQGAVWGWRTLSPDQPFNNGRAYSVETNKKIMIIMSDGDNTYYPLSSKPFQTDHPNAEYSTVNKSIYGSWGLSVNGRIFDGYSGATNPVHNTATFRESMNEQLAQTCVNIKDSGITIYTIAFDVVNGSSVETLLKGCASSDGTNKLYFDASDNASLVTAFADIAEDIVKLRITE